MNVMMSSNTWNQLTEEQQQIVTEAFTQASASSIDDAEKADEEYLKKLEDEGMQVVRFSDEQLKSFAEDVRANVWPEFESVYGADFMAKLQDALK